MKLNAVQQQALLNLGVAAADLSAFEIGEAVLFRYPTYQASPAEGFVQLTASGLVSQLFYLSNPRRVWAMAAMKKFVKGSESVAKALGLQELELQGGTVVNGPLAASLRKRGFAQKQVTAPDLVGGGQQEVFWRRVKV